MGLPPSKYPPKNQKYGFHSKYGGRKQQWGLAKNEIGPELAWDNGGWQKMKSGLNWLGSNSNGLILWENDATMLGIVLKRDF